VDSCDQLRGLASWENERGLARDMWIHVDRWTPVSSCVDSQAEKMSVDSLECSRWDVCETRGIRVCEL
jgi:hypothetical protein